MVSPDPSPDVEERKAAKQDGSSVQNFRIFGVSLAQPRVDSSAAPPAQPLGPAGFKDGGFPPSRSIRAPARADAMRKCASTGALADLSLCRSMASARAGAGGGMMRLSLLRPGAESAATSMEDSAADDDAEAEDAEEAEERGEGGNGGAEARVPSGGARQRWGGVPQSSAGSGDRARERREAGGGDREGGGAAAEAETAARSEGSNCTPQPAGSEVANAPMSGRGGGMGGGGNTGGSASSKERKKGIPWTEEEHRLFLIGLSKLGKGDWRGISRNYVTTRTPTQVASHAQKYFIRQSNLNKRKRRSSLFDISADVLAEEAATTMSRSMSTPSLPSLRDDPKLLRHGISAGLSAVSSAAAISALSPGSAALNSPQGLSHHGLPRAFSRPYQLPNTAQTLPPASYNPHSPSAHPFASASAASPHPFATSSAHGFLDMSRCQSYPAVHMLESGGNPYDSSASAAAAAAAAVGAARSASLTRPMSLPTLHPQSIPETSIPPVDLGSAHFLPSPHGYSAHPHSRSPQWHLLPGSSAAASAASAAASCRGPMGLDHWSRGTGAGNSASAGSAAMGRAGDIHMGAPGVSAGAGLGGGLGGGLGAGLDALADASAAARHRIGHEMMMQMGHEATAQMGHELAQRMARMRQAAERGAAEGGMSPMLLGEASNVEKRTKLDSGMGFPSAGAGAGGSSASAAANAAAAAAASGASAFSPFRSGLSGAAPADAGPGPAAAAAAAAAAAYPSSSPSSAYPYAPLSSSPPTNYPFGYPYSSFLWPRNTSSSFSPAAPGGGGAAGSSAWQLAPGQMYLPQGNPSAPADGSSPAAGKTHAAAASSPAAMAASAAALKSLSAVTHSLNAAGGGQGASLAGYVSAGGFLSAAAAGGVQAGSGAAGESAVVKPIARLTLPSDLALREVGVNVASGGGIGGGVTAGVTRTVPTTTLQLFDTSPKDLALDVKRPPAIAAVAATVAATAVAARVATTASPEPSDVKAPISVQ